RSRMRCADDLEGDEPVHVDLPRLVDDAHPAAPQHAEDLVAGSAGERLVLRWLGERGSGAVPGRQGARWRRGTRCDEERCEALIDSEELFQVVRQIGMAR